MNFETLNEKQKQAILEKGNVLVIAGAGTGKTWVLTSRIAYYIKQGIDQDNIYAFTFTNKAASEMKSRLAKMLNNVPRCNISTFHSYFFQELNMNATTLGFTYPISIIDSDDILKIIRSIIEEQKFDIKDSDVYHYISNIKNHIINNYKNLQESTTVGFIFNKLQEELLKINRMDFDDILYYYDKLLDIDQEYLNDMRTLFKYVLIDESQDMNQIQYEIISKLSKKAKSLFLVGDQDQCIYTFRGSNLEIINRFFLDFNAKTIVLEENYRSSKNILESANKLIKFNNKRIEKNLFTTNEEDNYKIFYKGFRTSAEEANYAANLILRLKEVGYKDSEICILYRNNMISNPIERELVRKQIPFTTYGSYPFFMHKEIKSLINHYRFCFNPNDDLSLEMIINYPKKRLTENEFSLVKTNSINNKISYFESLKELNLDVYNNLLEIKTSFENQTPKEFINYLINKLQLIELISKEKNPKNKISRILEFKNYIEELPEVNHIQETKNLINNIYLQNTKEKQKDTISLMTIHQAKGLEFKTVILVGCNHGILPSSKSIDTNNEEERRLFYVAITRAKERLFLTSSQIRFINGKFNYYPPSNFLLEMGIN